MYLKKHAYHSTMRKLSLVIIASALLLTGCGSQPKYDEVELIQYEACVTSALNIFERSSLQYGELVTNTALDACKKYLPVKK